MDPPGDALARAERRVREAEGHVAHLIAIIDEMDRHNHPRAADRARRVLVTVQRSLELSRDHLRIERQGRGLEP